ncbi:MAG TPA: PQQ-binding-like beta-propeller repeat protein [Planctomycetota bacterium]|nr:PQQ-binding-like beta-propeller repeat protein [Planctomycetota bacterium]
MKTILSLSILCASIVLNCAASDWPGWRGEHRDGHVPSGEAVPEKLPATPRIVWHVPTADGFSSPVVASGKVVLTDFEPDKNSAPATAPAGKKPPKAVPAGREIVRALNAATGDELWHVDLDSQHKDGFGTGPRCTPLIDGNLVFAQSTKGELKCLNLADGKTVWSKNYIKDFGQKYVGEVGQTAGAARHGNNGSPLVDGEHLIALPGATGAGIVCFNKKTGDIVWKSQDDMAGYAPPVKMELCGTPQYVVFTAIALIGLDPADGKLLWRSPVKTSLGRHVTTPVSIVDTVIVSSHQAGIAGVKISKDGSGFKAEQIWANKEAAINFASPVAANGHLFGVGNASKLVCIEPLKGEIAWDQAGYLNKDSTHAHASLLVLGKNILALTDMGELLLFPADPKEFHEISRVKICGPTWCNPPYAGGRLYVRDANELQCIDLLK